jgi:hypothetical protein
LRHTGGSLLARIFILASSSVGLRSETGLDAGAVVRCNKKAPNSGRAPRPAAISAALAGLVC